MFMKSYKSELFHPMPKNISYKFKEILTGLHEFEDIFVIYKYMKKWCNFHDLDYANISDFFKRNFECI